MVTVAVDWSSLTFSMDVMHKIRKTFRKIFFLKSKLFTSLIFHTQSNIDNGMPSAFEKDNMLNWACRTTENGETVFKQKDCKLLP